MNASIIRKAIETEALAALGNEFKVLPNIFDIESNDSRNLNNGIAVRWGSIRERLGNYDQGLSVEQDFTIDISLRSFVTMSDGKTVDKVDTFYTSLSTFLKRAVNEKLGLGNTNSLYEVRLNQVSEPRPFNDNQRDIVRITVIFIVAYLIN